MKSIAAGLLAAAWLALSVGAPAAGEPKRIVGVFYDGCENICQGFKSGIADSGIEAEITIVDLHQDKANIPDAVALARAMPADLVLTYGTTGTLGVIGTLDDLNDPRFIHDIPVVFTIVADPFGTRIAASFEGSGRPNVTGTFNRAPESVNIEVIRQYDPDFDKLGLLYNTNEGNSAIKYEELKQLAPTLGVELVALEIALDAEGKPIVDDIPVKLAELSRLGVRWLYVGSSSFLNSNGEFFTQAAVDNGIAVVSPYEPLVREHQAMLSIAARLEDVGRLAAEQALRILKDGAVPGDLPIVRATDFAYVVNMGVAKRLDRYPPFAFLQVAETVNR